MPAKRPPGLDYTLRTATMRTTYKGAHVEGLELLFVALPDALARRKMLDRLERAHAKLLARESGPEEGGSQVHPESALPSMSADQARAATNCGLGFAVPGAKP